MKERPTLIRKSLSCSTISVGFYRHVPSEDIDLIPPYDFVVSYDLSFIVAHVYFMLDVLVVMYNFALAFIWHFRIKFSFKIMVHIR